ncbi:V-type ATP synthase subunit I [Hyperthermus butylicus]|uniref:A-type ATP synthase subunit I n=1 Tax=Hyperthermus butylicus (strain DSM 5456 / JCM 9403 / PLM1-5) TaxID=415426 RepID=A2BKX9_HYPBU|nr:V-type ATP synthase subunit I [Hyperthermus butylicus]ABM80640.1 V-type ATP synthase subunit I [Hyperthermus butylicus DSM 5456]
MQASLLVAQATVEVIVGVPRGEYARTVKALAESSVFHPEPLEGIVAHEVRRLRNELEAVAERLRQAATVAGVAAGGEAVVRIKSSSDAGLSELLRELSTLASSVSELVEKLAQLQNPESELSKKLRILQYYAFIDVDLERLTRSRHVRAKVYRIPLGFAEEFIAELSRVEGVVVAYTDGIEPGYMTIVVVYPARLETEVGKVALRHRAEPLEIPEDWPRIPARAVERARRELEELPRRIGEYRPQILRALTAVEAAVKLLRLLEATKFTRTAAFIHGYVDPSQLDRLEEQLQDIGVKGFVILVREESHRHGKPGHGEEEHEAKRTPSFYRVTKLLAPFADLLSMSGHPRPGEVVPVVLMAITLPVIYGLMFPDLGHGLVLLLAGYYLFYKRMGNVNLGRLVMYFGIAAMVTGFLAGEFFGPHPVVAGWLSEGIWHGHPPLASPLHEFVTKPAEEAAEAAVPLLFNAIYLSLLIGALVMTVSSLISIVNGVLLGDREVLVASIGKTLIFGSILLALTLGAAAGAGAAVLERAAGILADAGMSLVPETTLGMVVRLLFSIGLLTVLVAPIVFGHGGLGEKIINGLMEAFDMLLMAIGNTASFMRIMGLMLAHSGLMFGFTILAMVAGPVLGAITYIFGNILTIGLEALVAYAHSLRLHLYEMFSKFYLDEGRPYQPLQLPATVKIEAA